MRTAALLVALALAGCSIWTWRPIRKDANGKAVCVDSYALPVVDTVIAGGAIANGIYLINTDRGYNIRPQIGTVFVVVGGITALVAGIGYYRVAKCRATPDS